MTILYADGSKRPSFNENSLVVRFGQTDGRDDQKEAYAFTVNPRGETVFEDSVKSI